MEVGGVASLKTQRAVAAALGVPATTLNAASDTEPRDGAPSAAPGAPPAPAKAPWRPAQPPMPSLLRTALPAVAVTLSIVAAIAVIAGVHLAQRRDVATLATVASAPPRVVTVGYGNVEHTVAATGHVRPTRSVTVKAASGGRVDEIVVAVGDTVEEGQPLAVLESAEQQRRVDSAAAGVAIEQSRALQRESALRVAASKLQEAEERYAAEGGDELARALDEARHGHLSAQTELFTGQLRIRESEAALEHEQTELERTRIEAPMAGTIVEVFAAPGSMLVPPEPAVLEIADLMNMTVVVAIGEADLPALRVGSEGFFTTLAGGDPRSPGTLREILPIPVSRRDFLTYSGFLDVDNSDRSLFPVMTVNVFFPISSAENVLTVPLAAVTFTASAAEVRAATVRVLLPDGGTETRDVVVGAMDRVNAEVRSGLREGDRVVADVAEIR
jgi:macrolide-specific efflux system membrane fusion protein